MEINAKLTLLCSEDKVILEITDDDASVQFLECEIDPCAFTAALGRLGHIAIAKTQVRSLDKIGKVMEHKTWSFEMPKSESYMDHRSKGIARRVAIQKCPDGWIPDLGFSTQRSFKTTETGQEMASTTIRRWVDKNDGS